MRQIKAKSIKTKLISFLIKNHYKYDNQLFNYLYQKAKRLYNITPRNLRNNWELEEIK